MVFLYKFFYQNSKQLCKHTFSGTNVIETQRCYFLGNISGNVQLESKFRNYSKNISKKQKSFLTEKYLESYLLEQVFLNNYILINFTDYSTSQML